MRSDKIRRLAFSASFAGVALMLAFVEALFPSDMFVPIPGFKIGLSNIAVMAALFFVGRPEAFAVAVVKITVSSILFSVPTAFFYSFAGTIFSLAALILISFLPGYPFSYVGISVVSALFHNIGQISVSVIMFGRAAFYFVPYLLIISLVSGGLTGVVMLFCAPTLTKICRKINR